MGENLTSGEWLERNRASWDERVPVHLESEFYDQSALRAGRGHLYPIEEAELARFIPEGLAGLRVLHLQCHFGADSLVLAQRGATVVGLDFSQPAIAAARVLAAEVGLADRARFVRANIYDARHVLPEPESFDVVFTTWGTIGWLPDVAEWARIIEWFLKPGGRLYFADGHPAAFVFDDPGLPRAGSEEKRVPALPGFVFPYDMHGDASVLESEVDYADRGAALQNVVTHSWMHPLSETVGAVLATGLRLEFLAEHFEVPWQMFEVLEPRGDGLWGWPAEKWLPLAMSLGARKATAPPIE